MNGAFARLVKVGAACLVGLSALACSSVPSVATSAGADAHSRIVAGPDGLRTFTVVLETGGVPVSCPAFALVDPVHGTLDGSKGAREPVWIITSDGRHLSVVWPAGFSVRFEPEATLYNEHESVVAAAGKPVELSQTMWNSAAGTFDDPYIAQGLVFGGCYPFVK